MTTVVEEIYSKAVRLNPIDRAELIEKLFLSFNPEQNSEEKDQWKEEVLRRRKAYDEGKIPADTIENVFERLAKR